MGKKSKAGKDLESGGLLLFIYNNRVPLVSITLLAAVVAVIVSLLITPRFRSTVILYPAPASGMAVALTGPAMLRQELTGFGVETDAERLLQVLQSDVIRDRMVEKYDLLEHYGIKADSRYPYTVLEKKFRNNVRSRKTEYMAVEIEVLDTDPVVAASMANDIAGYIDSVMNRMLKERAERTLAIVGEEYRRLKLEIETMQDSLDRIRRLGVIDYESQSEVLSNAYASAVLSGDTASMNFFRDRIRTLSAYGGAYVSLRDNLLYQVESLNELKIVYDQALVNAREQVPYKFIVDEARAAEKKSYPVRSMIVIVSTISAFIFALFVLVLIEAFRKQVFKSKRV